LAFFLRSAELAVLAMSKLPDISSCLLLGPSGTDIR
jgi:hypothetical protein